MGENRKIGNEVDQIQNVFNLETGNSNKNITEDFLFSDDFSVIVNRKTCKKNSECEDFGTSSQSLSELNIFDSEGIGKVINIEAVTSDECSLQCLAEDSSNSSKSSLKNFLNLKANAKTDLETSVNDENKDINPDLCAIVTFENGVSTGELLSNKNVVIKDSCHTKKKNKKKINKKNSVEEEVEKLIKNLQLDDKLVVEPKTNTLITAFLDKNSQHLKSADTTESINNDSHDTLCKANSALIDPALKKKVDLHHAQNELKFTTQDHEKKSLKKKGKKLKDNRKAAECENSNFNLPQVSCTDTSNMQEVSSVESACSSTEKDILVPKVINESGRKGKRPSKKQLALIHEALKKAKEEEEKQQKEAEMKQKMLEEAEKMRQEKLQQELEKKEKKKLKDKQRREKLKAEGRLLSKSQKQSRARMEASLAALRQQGVEVPQINDKKTSSSSGSRIGNCKNFQRKRNNSSQSVQSNDSAIVVSERHKSESLSSQESSGKESLSDLPSNFDSIDDSPLNPESDKGNASCSEESDGLDDGICQDLYKSKKPTGLKSIGKTKHSNTEILSLNHVNSSESPHKENCVKYRSPVVCVLGHVDTGKTKLLDYIRKTHIQDSEAGGITQQIGATMIPRDALKEKCKMVKEFSSFHVEVPGLLVIDTPGHESFGNLRSRGSSICDIAILVVDIMHGLEPQTFESINLLKRGKIPFIVALNKIDRLYGWKSNKDEDIESSIKCQSQVTQSQFQKLCQEIILQFANECLNVVLFYENKDPRSYISMVPTSAVTGDGMGNLLNTVTHFSQTVMRKKLIYSEDLEATVLEVKAIPGLGTTIDVILVNGRLKEGDTIIIAGQEGPIVTQIRSLLMPQPLKELRVKNPYIEYKTIKGAQGVKITGKDLEKSIAGLPLLVASNQNMLDIRKDEMNCMLRDVMNSIKTSERGVYVQASTLGSLEALLDFLSASGVSYFHAKIGPVVKKDVMKASIMLEHDSIYAAILAFDVKIERDAQELADSLGVHIFHADIIYHLLDMYIHYRDNVLLKRNEEIKRDAVFPCKLRILPEFVFNLKDPIVLGVSVEQGILKEGTPLCIPTRGVLEVGIVSSIEMNNNKIDCAKKGDEVCITIEPKPGESSKIYGKHFNHEDLLISHISRQSIDVCKQYFRNELHSSDWQLIIELKKILHIV